MTLKTSGMLIQYIILKMEIKMLFIFTVNTELSSASTVPQQAPYTFINTYYCWTNLLGRLGNTNIHTAHFAECCLRWKNAINMWTNSTWKKIFWLRCSYIMKSFDVELVLICYCILTIFLFKTFFLESYIWSFNFHSISIIY